MIKKSVPTESFFNFFAPPKAPSEDDEDEDAESDIEERLELDYQLGEDIKEKLIPRAIDWFTGEALAFEEIDEDDLEAGDFDDEEDDEDDLSEDHDDEEESEDDVSCSLGYAGSHQTDTLVTGRIGQAKAGGGGVQAELNEEGAQ